MHSSDTIEHTKFGFNGYEYIELQTNAIQERLEKFDGKLYLEIGGKFLSDPHAQRVLPGFFPDSKKQIFEKFSESLDIIFCLNAQDLYANRQLSDEDISYWDYCIARLLEIKNTLQILPKVVINRISTKNQILVDGYSVTLNNYGFDVYFRYDIEGYPNDTGKILSQDWYGKDDFIKIRKDIVLVTGAASSSGKMSTCLGQIYHDKSRWIDSGYAKYETFPVWDLDLGHPVNLAYEAATADIADHNSMDELHKKAYWVDAVNYNRDVEAFEIVSRLAADFLPEENFTRSYKSPTDMWISTAGKCIYDQGVIEQACREEIKRRMSWYRDIIARGDGDEIWIARCENLLKKLEMQSSN